MVRPLIILSTLLAVSFSLSPPALATKYTAKPLPRNGDPAGQSSHSREEKVWGSDTEALPLSRFKRRLDYRDQEKLDAEEQRHKELLAEEDRKAALLRQKEVVALSKAQQKENKQLAIECNNQAVAFGQKGKWNDAIAAHERAVKYDPESKQFRINLSAARTACGEQLLHAHKWEAASAMFRNALAAAPDNAAAGRLLADSLDRMGVDPLDVDVRIKIGDQLLDSGDSAGAYIEYQQAYQIEKSSKVYVKLGDVELRFQRITNAASWYQKAISVDPNCGAAYRQLAYIQLASSDKTGAAASLRKAVILNPADAAAGQALVELWRKQVAANSMLAENHLGLAGALQLTGDFVGAESEYKRLELLDANHPGLLPGRASLQKALIHARAEKHKLAADTLYSQGLKREALAEISQAVMAEPRNAKYQFLLGECLESIGDYRGAHQAYLTCVLIDPESNKEAASRMKAMQGNGAGGQTPQPHPQHQGVPNRFNHPMMHQQGIGIQQNMAMPQQQMMVQQQAMGFNNPMMAKTFEGGPGVSNVAMGGFRTHDDGVETGVQMPGGMAANQNLAFQGQPGAISQGPQTRSLPMNHAGGTIAGAGASTDTVNVQAQQPMAGSEQAIESSDPVSAREQARDYVGAATILRQMVAKELENPAVHHRLAVNLLAAGNASEAVTEFRISSALDPKNKIYSEDLARALAIHKKTVTASKTGVDAPGNGSKEGSGGENP